MNTINLNAIFRLRRDNDYNYQKVAEKFIPQKGEVCLVDTAYNGLRAKIGDGLTLFAELPYIDKDISTNIIIRGYFSNNQFYSDANLTILVEASVNKIYIDAVKNIMYIYDGKDYILMQNIAATATETSAGIMKLYNNTGENTDGTMTQKAITDELNQKIEAKVNGKEELLQLITN